MLVLRCQELFDSRYKGEEAKEGQSLGGCFNEAPSFVYELVKVIQLDERHEIILYH